jgi:hypothetical protein
MTLVKPPFAGLDRRVAFLRATLLTAASLGLIASLPAWMNTRSFPLVPIVPAFPILPSPGDKVLLGAMLAALIVALWSYRVGVMVFLCTSFFAFCEDQNRGQPWLYMYWVMLALSLASSPVSVAACRIAMPVVYFWSGVQKLNHGFFAVIPGWFVTPAVKWHWPAPIIEALKAGVAAAPFIEIALAILLWIPRLRSSTIAAALVLHSVSLIFLGPLGYNYNWVVWPWNAAMMALVWGLFSRSRFFKDSVRDSAEKSATMPGSVSPKKPIAKSVEPAIAVSSIGETLRQLCNSRPACLALLLYALLPLLSFGGWWDSYFSFSLYAENAARANIFITQTFADRLPVELRKYVQPFAAPYDPQHQGPLMLGFDPWCYEELHVPPIPEVRNFKGIFNHLKRYAQRPEELRMVIGPRHGPVIFLQGDDIELLRRK